MHATSHGRLALGVLLSAPTLAASHGDVVQVIDTTVFGSSDPAGMSPLPSSGTLLMVDSEVNETPFYIGANLWELDHDGNVLRAFTTVGLSDEPTGVAANPITGTVFFTDDDFDRMHEVALVGTDLVSLGFVALAPLGILDAEAVAAHPVTGNLWIADGSSQTLFELSPAGQLLTTVPLAPEVLDPEGLEFDVGRGRFLVSSAPARRIFEVDAQGSVVDSIDLQPVRDQYPGFLIKGFTIAPSSDPLDDPLNDSIYVADYGWDEQNDGRIFELTYDQAPQLAPIADVLVTVGDSLVLDLSAGDPDGDALTFTAQGLPAFASLVDLGGGAAQILIAPGAGAAGVYPVTVTVTSTGIALPTDEESFVLTVQDPPPLGTNYCTANPNSSGAPGSISATGSVQVAQNDLTLTAAQLPVSEFGYFLSSPTQGFIANPAGSAGNFCLGGGGQLGRYAGFVLSSGAQGTFSMAVDLGAVPISVLPGSTAIQPGDTWNFQAWFRDLGSNNFTDAVSIVFE